MKNYAYVNTKMGTENTFRYSNGNCNPITAVPHGMASFTIQSDTSATGTELKRSRWFYSPYAKSFEGIRLTHMPSPWLGDYGAVVIAGQRGEFVHHRGIHFGYIDREKTVIEPAYISARVIRDRYNIELTPTNSGAVIRIKFDEGNGPYRLTLLGDPLLLEHNKKNGFILGKITDNKNGSAITEYLAIKPNCDFTLDCAENVYSITTDVPEFECRIATSYLSEAQARLNFKKELNGKSFDSVKKAATALWNKYLDKIQIADKDKEKKKTFYSCMYRAFLWPRRFYEIGKDGKPYHINFATGEPTEGYLYVDNGWWDTFRTLYPYLSLIDTELYAEMAEGFYNYYVDNGWLPKWLCPNNANCMPGMLIEATMGDAIVKEIVKGELAENILDAMLKDGEVAGEKQGDGRVGIEVYRKYGYVPYNIIPKESVNETLDNSFGDYCIAMAAKKLGRNEIAEKYFKYAQNYRNLFDKEAGFMRAKDDKGNFRDEVFNPFAWGRDYTEGSAWQNAFGVYHDIEGLNELYEGGLEAKIDELMTSEPRYDVGGYSGAIHEMQEMYECRYGQCAISNQPSFHVPFIYSRLGVPEKTAKHVSELSKLFSATPEGYPGDEDNGTTSSWYLLASMGLYQMAPSKPEYETSLPLFDRITVRLANGKELVINKADYDLSKMSGKVSYFDIMAGGNLAEIVKNK